MSALAYVVTALLVLVVVATRMQLRRPGRSGHTHTGEFWIGLHTGAGVLAALLWLVFLIRPEDSALGSSLTGVIGLFFWWLTGIAGLGLMLRWKRSRGRRAVRTEHPRAAAVVSVATHVLAFAGIVFLTWCYLISVV